MPETLQAVSATNVKIRWKETYVSEGINRRMAVVIPRGIYRGFELSTSVTNLSVTIQADAAFGDHVAVYESDDGFSTSVRDTASGDFDVDLSASVSDTVVIALFVEYEVGVATAAELKSYTVTEYDALTAAVRGELVVLGTVVVPASGLIGASSITYTRRTLPWAQRAANDAPWNPLIKNGDFEISDTGAVYPRAAESWRSGISSGLASWTIIDTDSVHGAKSFELTATGATTVSASLVQQVGIPVIAGQSVKLVINKRIMQASATGSGLVRATFMDKDGAFLAYANLFYDITATDGAFEEQESIVVAPAGAVFLSDITVLVAAHVVAGAGAVIRIDKVQAHVQPQDGSEWLPVLESVFAPRSTTDIVIYDGDPVQYSFEAKAAAIRYDSTTNALVIERKDSDSSLDPVDVNITGAISGLGSGLATVAADAEVPLVASSVNTAASYTLVNLTQETSSDVGYRLYVSATGELVQTINAKWNTGATNWSKDSTPDASTMSHQSSIGVVTQWQEPVTTPWNDNAWTRTITSVLASEATTVANGDFAPIISCEDAGGNNRVIVDHNGFLTGGQTSRIVENWLGASAPPGWSETGSATVAYAPYATIGARVAQMYVDAGSQAGVLKHSGVWVASDDMVIVSESVVSASHSSADFEMGVGFSDDPVSANFMLFIADSGTGGNWDMTVRGTGSVYLADTTVGIATAASQILRMEWYGANMPGGARVLFYIDGVLTGETALVPETGTILDPYFSIGEDGSGASQRSIFIGPYFTMANMKKSDVPA